MIELFLIINNLGKLRFSRFYDGSGHERQKQLQEQLFELAKTIDEENSCNFTKDTKGIYDQEKKHNIIVRHFATLYFIMVADDDESELGLIDVIQILVEGFDTLFENACELDLVYHPDKIGLFIDEVIAGGTVLDTNTQDIVAIMKKKKQLEDSQPL